MREDSEIISEFYNRVGQFINSPRIQSWRKQLAVAYQMRDGVQWELEEYQKRINRRRPIHTMNLIASVVRMIAGQQIVNRDKIKYFSRSKNNQRQGKNVDIVTDAVQYITDDNTGNGFYGEWAKGLEDKLICGIGFTDTYFSYRNPEAPQGEVRVDRLFPGNCIFDLHSTKSNLSDALWMGHFEIVSTEIADREKEAAGVDPSYSHSQKVPLDLLLAPFKNREFEGYSVIYHYYWVEDVNSYSVKREDLEPYAQHGEEVFSPIQQFLDENSLTIDTATLFLNEKQMKALREAVAVANEFAPIDLPKIKVKKTTVDGYYYARICDGVVLEKRPSICKSRHSMVARTCYYNEQEGYWYGIVNDMIDPQRAFNLAISDYISYLKSVPKGGMIIEEDGVADWKNFKQTQAHEEDVTVVAKGALAGGKVQAKSTPQAVSGLDNFLMIARQLVTAVTGIDPAIFNGDVSGNMTADLFGRQMRQSYKVLALAFDGEKSALRNQGKVFLDCVKILAENKNGQLIRRLSGSGGEDDQIELNLDELSGEYDVIISSSPVTEDERFELVKGLVPLSGSLQNNPEAQAAVTQMIIEDYPFIDNERRIKILQAMQPQPPMPPDPNNVALIQSQAQLQAAQANRANAEAQRILQEIQQTPLKQAQELADLEKTQSEALKNYSAAGEKINIGINY